MKNFSNFVSEKPFFCTVEGCSMKFENENHLAVHKKRHEMILNLGLGQRVTTFTDQTPTPTQFIRNCEEVGLFQDLQNVNPFEETFKKAVEAVKSGHLTLESSLQSTPPDDTLHTPNIFPNITDIPNVNASTICKKSDNIPASEGLNLRHSLPESEKLALETQPTVDFIKKENEISYSCADSSDKKILDDNKVILNVPEGHLVQLLTPPEESQNSCNMVVIKNTTEEILSSLPVTVKEKFKKNFGEKKTGKSEAKVPITKCAGKKNCIKNKFSKFSKNAMKLITKLENPEENEKDNVPSKPKKISKTQTKESRIEFLERSRAASSRCREKKKLYLLYLEKVNSELSTANQNLLLINSLLRQEINQLHNELSKHKNCNAADQNTEAALATAANLIGKKTSSGRKKIPEIPAKPKLQKATKTLVTSSKKEMPPHVDVTDLKFVAESENDPSLFSLDVAEVILSEGPEESEIPLNEGNKPPDIIVRFNSVSNDFPTSFPSDCSLDRFIEKSGEKVKQIYGEHSYYLKKPSGDVERPIMNYKTFRDGTEPTINSEECKTLNALHVHMKQNDAFRDLTSLNSKILIGPRTPPPLILLKPFKKRTIQSKRNEKT